MAYKLEKSVGKQVVVTKTWLKTSFFRRRGDRLLCGWGIKNIKK